MNSASEQVIEYLWCWQSLEDEPLACEILRYSPGLETEQNLIHHLCLNYARYKRPPGMSLSRATDYLALVRDLQAGTVFIRKACDSNTPHVNIYMLMSRSPEFSSTLDIERAIALGSIRDFWKRLQTESPPLTLQELQSKWITNRAQAPSELGPQEQKRVLHYLSYTLQYYLLQQDYREKNGSQEGPRLLLFAPARQINSFLLALSRLLPPQLLQDISFSTYEDDPGNRTYRICGRELSRVENVRSNRYLPSLFVGSIDFVIDMYTSRASLSTHPFPSDFIQKAWQYASFAVQSYKNGQPAHELLHFFTNLRSISQLTTTDFLDLFAQTFFRAPAASQIVENQPFGTQPSSVSVVVDDESAQTVPFSRSKVAKLSHFQDTEMLLLELFPPGTQTDIDLLSSVMRRFVSLVEREGRDLAPQIVARFDASPEQLHWLLTEMAQAKETARPLLFFFSLLVRNGYRQKGALLALLMESRYLANAHLLETAQLHQREKDEFVQQYRQLCLAHFQETEALRATMLDISPPIDLKWEEMKAQVDKLQGKPKSSQKDLKPLISDLAHLFYNSIKNSLQLGMFLSLVSTSLIDNRELAIGLLTALAGHARREIGSDKSSEPGKPRSCRHCLAYIQLLLSPSNIYDPAQLREQVKWPMLDTLLANVDEPFLELVSQEIAGKLAGLQDAWENLKIRYLPPTPSVAPPVPVVNTLPVTHEPIRSDMEKERTAIEHKVGKQLQSVMRSKSVRRLAAFWIRYALILNSMDEQRRKTLNIEKDHLSTMKIAYRFEVACANACQDHFLSGEQAIWEAFDEGTLLSLRFTHAQRKRGAIAREYLVGFEELSQQ